LLKDAEVKNMETIYSSTNTKRLAVTAVMALALAAFVARSAQGQTFTVIHSFKGQPFSGLLRDKAGNLYGTTASGGSSRSGLVSNWTARARRPRSIPSQAERTEHTPKLA
jgi:hypothetical protein